MPQPSNQTVSSPVSRPVQWALFLAGCLWLLLSEVVAERTAQNLANRLNLAVLEPLLNAAGLVLLLTVGFTAVYRAVTRSGGLRSTNALPKRRTSTQEWLRGAALGWAMLLAAVVPMMLTGALHPQLWLAPRSWGLAALSLATLALLSLAMEVAFRGFLFGRLIAALGPVAATTLLSLAYALLSSLRPNATLLSIAASFLTGVLLSLAYLRTHGIWFGWGLHFAWDAATGVLFGLPVAGYATYSSLVATTGSGPDWLSGGGYGPLGALFTCVVVLAAVPFVYRFTRDYAWNYTQPEIVPAGYAVVIAPPAAHTAMEESAAKPTPLVQILGATPTNASTLPVIEEHLRASQHPNGQK